MVQSAKFNLNGGSRTNNQNLIPGKQDNLCLYVSDTFDIKKHNKSNRKLTKMNHKPFENWAEKSVKF